MNNENILKIKNLKTYFNIKQGIVKAVDGVSFGLKKGESLGLVGESGCGKTTTALSIIRLLPNNGYVESGEILFNGKNILSLQESQLLDIRWKDISMIFQGAMNSFNPVIKISDQIMEAIRLHEEITKKKARERSAELLNTVNIDYSLINSYPHEFSGGMRQRAMIAMALVCNPNLIIADEPTTALDVMVQAQIIQLINNLRKKFKMSMVMISHDLSVIIEACDRIAVMYAGKIVEIGSTDEIIFNFKHPYTEKLVKAFPDIYGERKMVESIPGRPPNLLEPPIGCRFAPRCHKRISGICDEIEPILKVYDKDKVNHLVACHNIDR